MLTCRYYTDEDVEGHDYMIYTKTQDNPYALRMLLVVLTKMYELV